MVWWYGIFGGGGLSHQLHRSMSLKFPLVDKYRGVFLYKPLCHYIGQWWCLYGRAQFCGHMMIIYHQIYLLSYHLSLPRMIDFHQFKGHQKQILEIIITMMIDFYHLLPLMIIYHWSTSPWKSLLKSHQASAPRARDPWHAAVDGAQWVRGPWRPWRHWPGGVAKPWGLP